MIPTSSLAADEDGNLELLPDARKVEAISVNYDRKAKHVRGRQGPVLATTQTWLHNDVQASSISYTQYSPKPNGLQVDVKELKTLLWQEMEAQRSSAALSFQSLLDGIPPVSAAGPVENVSVHTCFICMLHLANEHGLRVLGGPTLATLDIQREAS